MCDLDSADSTACLDVCSGYEALIPDIGDFAYRYNTSGFETSSEYDDDSGYLEVGTKTTVDVAATAYHEDPGEDFSDTVCFADGCLPALAHGGDSSDLESGGGAHEITFTSGEAVDLMGAQVAFFKGEEPLCWRQETGRGLTNIHVDAVYL
eukprot:jgi/Undpi1/4596/HiC_scaffold_18.g07950.m1